MTITKEEIEAVLAGCKGVTPGPWGLVPAGTGWLAGIDSCDGAGGKAVVWPTKIAREPQTGIENPADAAHIARLSPEFVRELATLALEALSSREAGWQPIETAPRDGERFLAVWGKRVVIASWGLGTYDRRTKKYVGGWSVGMERNAQVISWTPLPTPPDQGSK